MSKSQTTKEVTTIKSSSGIPMDEKSYEEWQQSFIDIEESIAQLKDTKEKKK